MARTKFPGVKQDGSDTPQQKANVLNQVLLGKMNCTLDVKLTAGATSTDIADPRLYETSALIFCPKTANASAHPMTYYSVSKGAATIHHDNNASTDRDGVLVILA